MTDRTIKASDLRDLMRCATVAFKLLYTKPEVFGEYAEIIDRAADALVSITATLTSEQRKYFFGGNTT